MSSNLLSVRSLKKRFGGLEAVNVDKFDLNENEITSLIGPNGAGKTTFFDLITRFQTADSGNINFDGKNVTRLNSYKLARLGMVRTFQLTRVFDRMSVYENMQFAGSSVSNEGFLNSLIQSSSLKNQEKLMIEKINETLELLNLSDMKNSYARELSGGQKKLLELGRSLMKSPKILLLDEPTANLDPFSLKLIEDIILEENKKGTCIILITHDMAQAKRLATNIIFMNKGEVIEQKNSKTFFNKPETNEALKYVKGEILL